jgi:DNA-binding NtrC family response regulator
MPTPESHPPFDVLVVDDEPDVLDLLAEYFRGRGARVTMVADGRAAVALLEREPSRFGLVVTDLQLPGVDGLGVLRAARQASPSCYVVIVTGYASLDSAIQAVRLGAYDYLTKPFSLGQLDVILARVQDRIALEDENRRLAKQVGAGGVPSVRVPLTEQISGIEHRLVAIEASLRELLERVPSRP